MPVCSCGCGESIPEKHLFRYRPPYYLRGHAPSPMCACGCGEQLPYSASRRYVASQFIRSHNRRLNLAPLLCACGCGEATTIHHGRPRKYRTGHNSTGVKRGEGRYINAFGYVMIRIPSHPDAQKQKGYVREHRWVMEQHIGRPLERHEDVHHLNAEKTDNRIENLQLLSRKEHGALHGWPDGREPSDEHRAHASAAMKLVWAKRRAGELPPRTPRAKQHQSPVS